MKKKYRVTGSSANSIEMEQRIKWTSQERKPIWFINLADAKQQVLKNRKSNLNFFLKRKEYAENELKKINEMIQSFSEPLNLDHITDDYLQRKNDQLEELRDKIQRGDDIF